MNNLSNAGSPASKTPDQLRKQPCTKEQCNLKTFTSADLWNIQRMGHSRSGRRFIG